MEATQQIAPVQNDRLLSPHVALISDFTVVTQRQQELNTQQTAMQHAWIRL